jgi:thioredoxin-dependent peroxiredoxin
MKAPYFSLQNQDDNTVTLQDFAGKWLIVYFYPKDDTPGCTKEACNFRDTYTNIQKLGAELVGISKDSVKSHKKFADKFNLNFNLLADESTETTKAFGAWGLKKFMGREYEGINRNTYVINPSGEIIKEFLGVNPTQHSSEIVEFLTHTKL